VMVDCIALSYAMEWEREGGCLFVSAFLFVFVSCRFTRDESCDKGIGEGKYYDDMNLSVGFFFFLFGFFFFLLLRFFFVSVRAGG